MGKVCIKNSNKIWFVGWFFKGNVPFFLKQFWGREKWFVVVYIYENTNGLGKISNDLHSLCHKWLPVSYILVGKMRSADMQKGGNYFVLNGKWAK